MADDLDRRIDGSQMLHGRLDLRTTDVGVREQDLPLEVARVHAVEIDDAERADPGRGEIQGDRRAEPSRPDDEHLAVQELALPRPADVRQDDVPRVPLDLVFGEPETGHATIISSSMTSPSRMKNERITGSLRSWSESRM